jgi:hypothetical protein
MKSQYILICLDGKLSNIISQFDAVDLKEAFEKVSFFIGQNNFCFISLTQL